MAYLLFPLLDHEYNSTETLHAFSNAVFSYLDTRYEPRGSQLLEPEKMKALATFMVPQHQVDLYRQISSLVLNANFLAFRIETVYTASGPSVTRAGLLAFLRAEIMSDPNEAFRGFNQANQFMLLGPPFVRAQFPSVAEPRTKVLASYVDASMLKTVKDMGWSSTAGQEEQLRIARMNASIKARGEQACVDLLSDSKVVYRYR
ncbi:hypothetical protein BGZ83_001549 [Gryganskiella cystojenkinii]|nr:hypothetical protein BGZ83_001549 [Gryganskiella cystojenkinii]